MGPVPVASVPPGGELSVEVATPGHARRLVQGWLDGLGVGVAVADVVLVVSELVTNALIHAASEPLLVGSRGERLRIEVHDTSIIPPARRRVDDEQRLYGAGGFGLQLVDALAGAWGWSATGTGKVVWATFPIAPTSGRHSGVLGHLPAGGDDSTAAPHRPSRHV